MTIDSSKKPLIEITDLVKKFGNFTALNGVSLDVYPGEAHALLGDNGAGKSTLIKILSGVHPATSGKIYVDSQEVKFSTPRQASDLGIGTVYQDLALNALTSVTRNFFLGREIKKGPGPFGLMQMVEMNAITIAEMAKIGINISNPNQPVGTMSGGQRQTLAIARAIYFGAKILILDEPTSALGQKQQMEVLKTIKKVQELGNIAIILITHDMGSVAEMAERAVVMYAGRKIEQGTVKEILTKPQHPYTQGLIACVPHLIDITSPERHDLLEIPGMVPPMSEFGKKACLFAPRCQFADARCHNNLPPERIHSQGHRAQCWLENLENEAVLP